ncbi:MAG: hypothetical protein C4617_04430 [Candidatus Liberibacter europaeus]|uniref:Uncharacterized protein n=1 Tax=Candidatus Liberibacter europaeus TaxID=744859 RepID=A0A2T4VWW2_9HYPH|nr:hypothetical protein [Candidatus Liberibacter europaeus]PTL86258.1 MAG: hypothetical protein C4617_04430 [Candidatus Liberibacter europaeus]
MSAYEPLKYSPTVSPDLSSVPPSEDVYSGVGKILSNVSNTLDKQLQYYEDQNDKTYAIQKSADLRIKADDLFYLHTNKIPVKDLNPDTEGFKNIGEKALEAFQEELNQAISGKKSHLRNQIMSSANEVKLNLIGRIKQFKIDAIKQHNVVRYDTFMGQTDFSLSKDGSDKNYTKNKSETYAFIDALPATTTEKITLKKQSDEKLAIQQAESISATNPLLIYNWHRSETSAVNTKKSLVSTPAAVNVETAPTATSDSADAEKTPKQTTSLTEAIDAANSKEEDIKPVTLGELSKDKKTVPFRGWEDLSPEKRHAYLNKSIGVASRNSKENRASADKFLKDADIVVKNGGVIDFSNPMFNEDSIRAHFPKNANDILEHLDIVKYVSQQNLQFGSLSFTQGQDYLAQIKPKAGSSAQEWRKYEKAEQAFENTYKNLANNPLEYALKNNIAGIQRLNLKHPETWGNEIGNRVKAVDVMKNHKGVNMPLFENKEIEDIEQTIDRLNPRDAGAFMRNLSISAGENIRAQKMLNETLKETKIGYAMPYISDGDYETAIKVIDGFRVMKSQEHTDPRGKFDREEKSGFYKKFDELFEKGFNQTYGSQRADLKNRLIKVTQAILASDASSSHQDVKTHSKDTTFSLLNPFTWWDDSNLEKAFEKAVGGKMQKVGGSYVVRIRGMSDNDFYYEFMDRGMEALDKAGYLDNTSGGKSYSRFHNYQFFEVADRKNTYGILGPARTKLIDPKTGEPIMIDFNQPKPSNEWRTHRERAAFGKSMRDTV